MPSPFFVCAARVGGTVSGISWQQPTLTTEEQPVLLDVARAAVAAAAHHRPAPPLPIDLPGRLREPAGAFVTLHDASGLRGCVGSVVPRGSLAALVASVAQSAACRDPRFDPISPEDLNGLRLDVSVLSATQPTAIDDIDPARHGVCLTLGARRAVLLPQVAIRYGWDRPTLLAHLCEKAELAPTAWRDPDALLLTFFVTTLEGAV